MKRRLLCSAAIVALLSVAERVLFKPWHERWGATDEEVHLRLPGDELVAEPARQVTRAITIDAAPDRVWPWVVQLGADRGGFYSYDWLENLFGLGIHSADRVVPEWQTREVGDLVGADAKCSGGWYVTDVRRNELLVMKLADVGAGRPLSRDEALHWEFLWTYALREGPDGTTRLLVRERIAFDSILTRILMAPVGLISFVMTRGMLRGIRARAERTG
jgi:hypothetical protein